MSRYAIESALFEVTTGPDKIEKFLADPDAFLSRFALTDEEKALIKAKDVRALADRYGLSQMLLMMFWQAICGFPTLPEYLGRMNNAPVR